jgi:ribosomal protein L11 methylase PrmA
MRDTLDAAAVVGLDRDNEAVVAHRYNLVLNRLRLSPHQPFERAR